MHVIVPSKSLSAALRTVKPAVGRLAALTCALLTADDDGLTITTSSVDLTITTRLDADVRVPGSALAEHGALTTVFGATETIELVQAEAGASVVARSDVTTMVPSGDVAHFPLIALRGESMARFDLDVGAIRSVLPAASKDILRPILTGVYFAPEGDIVATDSYRLHMVSGAHTAKKPMLVPATALAAVAAHVKKGTVTVDQFGDQVLILAPDGTTWNVRLLDPGFPDYRRLITNTPVHQVRFPRPAFEQTLRSMNKAIGRHTGRAGIFADETRLRVAVRLDRDEHNENLVHADLPGSAGMTFGFNPEFLAAAVAGLRTCTLNLTADPLQPMWLRETDDNGLVHLRLVMPVKLWDSWVTNPGLP